MTITIAPSANSPLDRTCDVTTCNRPAVADAQLYHRSQWAYLCMEHLQTHGTTVGALITNITSAPLTLNWIRG